MFAEAEVLVYGEGTAKVDFHKAEHAEETGRSDGNDDDVDEGTGDAYPVRASEAGENAGGLAKDEKGEDAAGAGFGDGADGGVDGGEQGEIGEDGEGTERDEGKIRNDDPGEQKASEVAVDEQTDGKDGAGFRGTFDPGMSGKNALAADDSDEEQGEGGGASVVVALEGGEREGVPMAPSSARQEAARPARGHHVPVNGATINGKALSTQATPRTMRLSAP